MFLPCHGGPFDGLARRMVNDKMSGPAECHYHPAGPDHNATRRRGHVMADKEFIFKTDAVQSDQRRSHNFVDHSGQKFGRLTVGKCLGGRRTKWECLCDCGKTTIVQGKKLRSGHTVSCGCLRTEMLVDRATIHGHAKSTYKHPVYRIWKGIVARCMNKNNKVFHRYGGRGIKICDRWLSYRNFYSDMIGTWEPGLSIDRIDNNGNYEQGNCRWASRKQQSRNTNRTIYVTIGGVTKPLAVWAEQSGLKYVRVYTRYRRGAVGHDLITRNRLVKVCRRPNA